MANELTDRRIVILQALEGGPKTWTYLRTVYYPGDRYKNKASTSFNNQLNRLHTKGLIAQTVFGYEITYEGLRQLEEVAEHPCPRCNTCIPADMNYCVGCQEDLRAAGRIV